MRVLQQALAEPHANCSIMPEPVCEVLITNYYLLPYSNAALLKWGINTGDKAEQKLN